MIVSSRLLVPHKIDAKCGDLFLQADLSLLTGLTWITSGLPQSGTGLVQVGSCMLHLSTSDGRKQNLDWHTLANMRGGEAANDRRAKFERKDARYERVLSLGGQSLRSFVH